MTDAELLDRFDRLLARVPDLPPAEAAAEAALFFEQAGSGDADLLLRDRLDDVGELDGAPWQLRVEANHRRLLRDRQVLRDAYNDLDLNGNRLISEDDLVRLHTLNRMLQPNTELREGPNGSRVEVEVRRQFVSLRTNGDGRVAEVFGDLSTAKNVVVSVHGMGVTIDDLATQTDISKAIQAEAGPDTAVIDWVYDGPNGLPGAVSKESAEQAAAQLQRFKAGLDSQIRPDARTTVFGHSYGTLVVAGAVRNRGAHFDNVIFAGSPGLGHDINSVADLNAYDDMKFFAIRAPHDAVSYSQWHGRDPADYPDITRLETAGGASVSWHEQYWRPNSESLRNIGRVIRGAHDKLTTTATTLAQETKLALGMSWGGLVRGLSTPLGKAFGKAFEGMARPAAPGSAATTAAATRRTDSGRGPEGPVR